MLFSRHLLICLYIEIKQYHWISVPKLFADKALGKGTPGNIPFYEMRLLHQKCSSELYLEYVYTKITPFYQHSPFLRVFLQGFWVAENLYYYTSAAWHWAVKNFLVATRKTCQTLNFCLINECPYNHTGKK